MNGGVLAPPNLHRIERPHALKILVRRAEYSLTENVASPFQAEPRHMEKTGTSRWMSTPLFASQFLGVSPEYVVLFCRQSIHLAGSECAPKVLSYLEQKCNFQTLCKRNPARDAYPLTPALFGLALPSF
jgi:hypothetical protein